jgi:hypothetical protein
MMTLIFGALAAIMLVLYLMRRRKRLSSED